MSQTRADLGVWLINPPRAADRRRKMDAHLARMDLAVTVFDGIDGKAEKDRLATLIDQPAFERTRAQYHEVNRFFRHGFRLFGLEPFPSHVDDGGQSLITGTGFGEVAKFAWYRRLPSYQLCPANYFRRLWWLAKRGYLVPRCTRNLSRGKTP